MDSLPHPALVEHLADLIIDCPWPWTAAALIERAGAGFRREPRWLAPFLEPLGRRWRTPPSRREIADALREHLQDLSIGSNSAIAVLQRIRQPWPWTDADVADALARFGVRAPFWLSKVLSEWTLAPGSTPDAAAIRERERAYLRRRQLDRPLAGALAYPVDRPTTIASKWDAPALETVGALAEWLEIPVGELEWFADLQGRLADAPGPLCHYKRHWIAKKSGGERLIEEPKPRLKAIQRRILSAILDRIPPHDAAHGFRRGRSALTMAERHVGRDVVLRMDLLDFFPTIRFTRVYRIFRVAGYPDAVAWRLAGLCTARTPASEFVGRRVEQFRGRPAASDWRRYRHLPQGAPTSPALANLAAHRLDRRLAGLARSAELTYTRYADDLIFSGARSSSLRSPTFAIHVMAIAEEEGFLVQPRKTRRQFRSGRQTVCGVVVNEKPNVTRQAYDLLKATLWNGARRGPASQNRMGVADFQAHLRGRVAHVAAVHPERGRKLLALFDAIAW